jgi:sugar-specific transcriptional regulator TrmB
MDIDKQLVEIGFTEYEAKAYVALLQLGPATGYQTAKESGVPRSTIYEVLNKLAARGAVLTQSLGDQVRYAPVPADILLNRLRHEFERNIDRLLDGFERLDVSVSLGDTWNLTGLNNLFAYARQMIMQATEEVVLMVGDDDELDALFLELQEAHARGIRLIVLSPTPYDAGDMPISVHPDGLSLRQIVGHGFVLVMDGRQALLADVERSQSAIWTTNGFAIAWALWCLKRKDMQ